MDISKQFKKLEELMSDPSQLVKEISKNCLLYTRVSTKEQAENNLSLDTQRSVCEEDCKKRGLLIVGYFGGTYESAKTDGRKEFERMMAFATDKSNNVGSIVIYSFDRFSRSGGHAIHLVEELVRKGIYVYSVTQPADLSTAEGRLMMNIHLIFANYFNAQLAIKVKAGLKERFDRGGYTGIAPRGYDWIRKNGISTLVPNDDAKWIKKAYEWKANEGLSDAEIIRRLNIHKFKIYPQALARIFRNPVYCGYLKNKISPGTLKKGTHEAIVSEQLFIRVNELLKNNRHGYKKKWSNPDFPLNRLIKDERTQKPFSGYYRRKQLKKRILVIGYYLINSREYPWNLRADKLHEGFANFLDKYKIPEDHLDTLRQKLNHVFSEMIASVKEENRDFQKQLEDVALKENTLKDKYLMNKITDEDYSSMKADLDIQRKNITLNLKRTDLRISNQETFIEYGLQISSKLGELWRSGTYETKIAVQKLAFPEGVFLSRENREFRTNRTNMLIELISSISNMSENNESHLLPIEVNYVHQVVRTGIEPVLPE